MKIVIEIEIDDPTLEMALGHVGDVLEMGGLGDAWGPHVRNMPEDHVPCDFCEGAGHMHEDDDCYIEEVLGGSSVLTSLRLHRADNEVQ